MEIWKEIIGYENYIVSNLGNVLSLPKKVKNKNGYRETKTRLLVLNNNNGYKYVCFVKDGQKKNYLVHRLVALAFLENTNNYQEVNHKDGNRGNNNVENLEWCTRQQNIDHSWEKGLTKCIGEGHHNSIFTEDLVREIRAKYDTKMYSYSMLGKMYGINKFTIRNVIKRYTWGHII